MERIIHHIEQLIILHDYVILPEFGGFIINSVPAKIDERKNVITAPHKEIYFNPVLNHNDGLLTNAIQLEENITFRQAKEIVSEDIEEIKKRLKNGDTIQLGKIGSLQKNPMGQTEFIPAASYDFLPDNIGTYPVKTGLHSRKKAKDEDLIVLQLPGNRKRLYRFAAAVSIIFFIAALTPVLHMQFSPYLAKINPLSFLAADSLPLFNSLPKKYTQGENPNDSAAGTDSLTSSSQKQAQYQCMTPWHVITGSYPNRTEALGNALQIQKQAIARKVAIAYSKSLKKEEVKPAPPAAPEKQTSTLAPPNINLGWHVVVANFETPKKARKFLEIMRATNKTPLAAYGGNNVYRIITGSFATSKEANAQLALIRQQPDFTTAWVLHNPTLLRFPLETPQTTTASTITDKAAAIKTIPQPKAETTATKANPAEKKPWHVIVANFETMHKSTLFTTQIKKKYNITLSVYGSNYSYRIIAGSFGTEKEAVHKLVEIKNIPELKNAWILQNGSLNKSQEKLVSYSAPATPKAEKQATTAEVPVLQPGTWYAIVANFKTQQQAQKYAETTGKRTKINLTVIKDNRLYRVVGGSFKTRDAVATKIQELHQYPDFGEAWPLCKP